MTLTDDYNNWFNSELVDFGCGMKIHSRTKKTG